MLGKHSETSIQDLADDITGERRKQKFENVTKVMQDYASVRALPK